MLVQALYIAFHIAIRLRSLLKRRSRALPLSSLLSALMVPVIIGQYSPRLHYIGRLRRPISTWFDLAVLEHRRRGQGPSLNLAGSFCTTWVQKRRASSGDRVICKPSSYTNPNPFSRRLRDIHEQSSLANSMKRTPLGRDGELEIRPESLRARTG
jgi:hypothetical protein